jgi:hypothetical protein
MVVWPEEAFPFDTDLSLTNMKLGTFSRFLSRFPARRSDTYLHSLTNCKKKEEKKSKISYPRNRTASVI